MGLRAHSLAWVLAFTVGVGGAGVVSLDAYLERGFAHLEHEAMQRDFRRLIGTLDESAQQRGRAAREWSQWTDLRDHLMRPNPGFAQANIGAASIKASGLAWLGLLDRSGTLVYAVAAESKANVTGIAARLLDRNTPLGRATQKDPGAGRCGYAWDPLFGSELMLLCQYPVLDGAGEGPSAGLLLTLETISHDELRQMGKRAALDFELKPWRVGEAKGWQPLANLVSGLGEGELAWKVGERHNQLRWPLADFGGTPMAWLELKWPRDLHQLGDAVLKISRVLFIALAALLALGAFVLVDWRLVRRLRSLRAQMERARERQDWTPSLHVRGSDEIAELADEGNHLLSMISQQVQRLEAHALTDPMTRLANRRAFDPRLHEALARCARNGQPLCLLMIDADHFKLFNDRHGHPAGDRALQVIADGMRHVARRAGDMAARLGGEEFALLFEGLDIDAVAERAMQLRAWMAAQHHGEGAALAQPLTLSLGLARARKGEDDLGLVARADAALYRAKQNGRDRLERDD